MADLTNLKKKKLKIAGNSTVFEKNEYIDSKGVKRVSFQTWVKVTNEIEIAISIPVAIDDLGNATFEVKKDKEGKPILWGYASAFKNAE